jgi:hypothetical protein
MVKLQVVAENNDEEPVIREVVAIADAETAETSTFLK